MVSDNDNDSTQEIKASGMFADPSEKQKFLLEQLRALQNEQEKKQSSDNTKPQKGKPHVN